ncbi:hypothetical protein GGQ10_002126 [Salinibacter ruber]|uniref:HK97 gp10 family phage protein n=1 Tax=Salinibacter ruber TaxID=146919 RepID=UPI002167745E|nr:HK97 gp10 family phage protein [Salinibacter ruber]MCS4087300.1 hypothetical protein [Salinibacter ruber]
MLETNADDVADELIGEFEEFEEEFEEVRDDALREAQRLAKQRVPVETGRLRDDISIDLEQDRLFNTLEYSIYQNWGTEDIEPTFYLTDSAIDAFQNSIERLRS